MKRRMDMEKFDDFIHGLTEEVFQIAERFLTRNNQGILDFDVEEAFGYFTYTQERTRGTDGELNEGALVQTALFICACRVMGSFKAMHDAGIDEEIFLQRMVTGEQITVENVQEIIKEKLRRQKETP